MVSSTSRGSGQQQQTLTDIFKRNNSEHKETQHKQREERERREFEEALRQSREEHVNEQKRLFERLARSKAITTHAGSSRSSTSSIISSSSSSSILKARSSLHDTKNNNTIPNTTTSNSSKPNKKRWIQRVMEEEDDDHEEWFQTVSSRPQPPILSKGKGKIVKQEKQIEEDDLILDIEDVSSWLAVKEEEDFVLNIEDVSSWIAVNDKAYSQQEEEEEDLVISDFGALLSQDGEEYSLNDNKKDTAAVSKEPLQCHICRKRVFEEEIEYHAVHCTSRLEEEDKEMNISSDSDCSVIDLVTPSKSKISSKRMHNDLSEDDKEERDQIVVEDEYEEDGYLSPLEGFERINRNEEEFNPYFQQLEGGGARKKRVSNKTSRTTSTSKRGTSKKRPRNFYKRKRK